MKAKNSYEVRIVEMRRAISTEPQVNAAEAASKLACAVVFEAARDLQWVQGKLRRFQRLPPGVRNELRTLQLQLDAWLYPELAAHQDGEGEYYSLRRCVEIMNAHRETSGGRLFDVESIRQILVRDPAKVANLRLSTKEDALSAEVAAHEADGDQGTASLGFGEYSLDLVDMETV